MAYTKDNSAAPENTPDFVIDSLARCLLPKIQAYFDSPEGKAEFEKWKQQRNT